MQFLTFIFNVTDLACGGFLLIKIRSIRWSTSLPTVYATSIEVRSLGDIKTYFGQRLYCWKLFLVRSCPNDWKSGNPLAKVPVSKVDETEIRRPIHSILVQSVTQTGRAFSCMRIWHFLSTIVGHIRCNFWCLWSVLFECFTLVIVSQKSRKRWCIQPALDKETFNLLMVELRLLQVFMSFLSI